MKKTLLALLVTLFPLTASAAEPTFGGFGYFAPGLFIGQHGMKHIGPDTSTQLGGGGHALLFRRLLIGGRGFGMLAPNSQFDIGAGGGGFSIGGLAYNQNYTFLYPYFGVDGIGMKMSGIQQIESGKEITSSAWLGDLGIGAIRQLNQADGGAMIGLQFGMMGALSTSVWTNDADVEVQGVPKPFFSGAYFRLTVGGGGFAYD